MRSNTQGLVATDSVEIQDGRTAATPLDQVYGYSPGWGLPSRADRRAIIDLVAEAGVQGGSAPPSGTATG